MPEETTTSQEPGTLSTGSAPQTGLEGATSSDSQTTEKSDERINGLMSRFHKEENAKNEALAEVERLRERLTIEVTDNLNLKSRITELESGTNEQSSAREQELTDLKANVARLEGENAKLKSEAEKMKFLSENSDLLPFADILPSVNDARFRDAVQRIRDTRKRDVAELRDHITTPRSSGATPRTSVPRTAEEIDAYLRDAPPGEFEKRLREVTGR